MPIYEYHCDECGSEFEELVLSRAAEREIACGKCGSANVVKLLSGSAVRAGASSQGQNPPPRPTGGCHGGGCGCH